MLDDKLFEEIYSQIEICKKLKLRRNHLLKQLIDKMEERFNPRVSPRYRVAESMWGAVLEPIPTEPVHLDERYTKCLETIGKLDRGELFDSPTTIVCSRSGEETNDFVQVDGKYVSRNMLTDNDFYCDYCREYHNTMHTDIYNTIGGGHICERVAVNYFHRCSQCGLYDSRENMRYTYSSDCMCSRCYDKLEKYQIRGYHHSPALIGYDYDKETGKNVPMPMENFKGYGIELEIDCAGESNITSKDVIQLLDDEVYTMHDGSIDDGFEIVTHPHTEDALYNMNWADTFKWLLKKGYRSHDVDTCGLHMHISRKLFKDNESICKMMYFYEKFSQDVIKMSRRTHDRVDRWAGFYSSPRLLTKSYIIDAFNAYNFGGHSSRYKCVNLTNRNTVEIRIMRGTLKLETFLATLDFIITVAKNSNNISWEDINNQELWLKGLKDSTVDYLTSRRAFLGNTSQNNINISQSESSIVISDDEIETIKYRLEEINKECV